MPLLDHFRPPLSERRHGWSFLSSWAVGISAQLNYHLPAGYFAEPNVQFGIEIDVAAMAEGTTDPAAVGWSASPPQACVPFTPIDGVVEVTIFSQSGGPTLIGAIELVSPANKDRPATRDAFVSKCATYLQAGVGLVVVDVVTERPADVPAELVARVGGTAGTTAGSRSTRLLTGRSGGTGRWFSTSGTSRWQSATCYQHCRCGSAAGCACRSSSRLPMIAPAENGG